MKNIELILHEYKTQKQFYILQTKIIIRARQEETNLHIMHVLIGCNYFVFPSW